GFNLKPIFASYKQIETATMSFFSSFFNCCVSSSSSSSRKVSDVEDGCESKAPSSEKQKKKPKSKGAPVVMSYFPINSSLSRL
ncbi:hypothetical protein VIGAN_07191100, partial [Vigna angularis var. angularis]